MTVHDTLFVTIQSISCQLFSIQSYISYTANSESLSRLFLYFFDPTSPNKSFHVLFILIMIFKAAIKRTVKRKKFSSSFSWIILREKKYRSSALSNSCDLVSPPTLNSVLSGLAIGRFKMSRITWSFVRVSLDLQLTYKFDRPRLQRVFSTRGFVEEQQHHMRADVIKTGEEEKI